MVMTNIKLFEERQVRSVWNITDEKWYFVVVDVVQILTDSSNPTDYIKKMRKRDSSLAEGWGQFVTPLLIETKGGNQKLNCADSKSILRIIQSIPSPKAEPFKLWLAQVGSDRLDEISNPELAIKRTRELYKMKGYSDDWIKKRIRSIAIREELTSEWKLRKIKEQNDYAILTSEISKATFGITPAEYKKIKSLKSQNLRDHMNDLELIFSMLGEASTIEIIKTNNPIGFIENKKAAKQGGSVAGKARKDLELKTGKNIVSSKNFLNVAKNNKEINLRKKN